MAVCSSEMNAGRSGQDALHFLGGPSYRGHKNLFRSGTTQYPSAFTRRGPGGHYVVHDQQAASLDSSAIGYGKRTAQVGPALMTRQSSLRGRLAGSDQRSGI